MLADMDGEMERRGLNAALVVGDSTYGNPELAYAVGAPLPRGGIYLKPLRKDPVLVVGLVDLGSAQRSAVRRVRTYSDLSYEALVSKFGYEEGRMHMYDKLLREEGVAGKIGLYGKHLAASVLHLADELRRMGYDVVGERPPTLMDVLRERKEAWELEEIRSVGRSTEGVVGKIRDFLAGCRTRGSTLYDGNEPLTVGRVKSQINTLLARQSLVAASDTIFAAGKRSSDPHYHGEADDSVEVDEPIVFDIFPQNMRGYCFDMTRTMVVGRPPRRFREMYDAVLGAQLHALDLAKEGAECKALMEAVCDDFERKSFPTPRSSKAGHPQPKGFTHSLGHGVGLTIGERPYLTLFSDEVLSRGHVVTVEPGLYDPEVGGARVEDVIAVMGSKAENFNSLTKEVEI